MLLTDCVDKPAPEYEMLRLPLIMAVPFVVGMGVWEAVRLTLPSGLRVSPVAAVEGMPVSSWGKLRGVMLLG